MHETVPVCLIKEQGGTLQTFHHSVQLSNNLTRKMPYFGQTLRLTRLAGWS